MYVHDSKRQGLRVRYVDNTFFSPFHFSTRLLFDHIVNCYSPLLGAEGKVQFFYFHESHFSFRISFFSLFLALFILNH